MWFTLFFDGDDRRLKVEILPPPGGSTGGVVDLAEGRLLIAAARRDLLAMSVARNGDGSKTAGTDEGGGLAPVSRFDAPIPEASA